MFDSETLSSDPRGGQTLDAEFVEVKRFQWVVPFLCGLFAALLIAAAVFAAFTLKMGPFAVSERQISLENAISGATDEIGQQVDDAAALQEAATLDPVLTSQAVSIGGMLFGPNSIQAIAQLASAETNGSVKCEPNLTELKPEQRIALTAVSCMLAAAPGQQAVSPQPAAGPVLSGAKIAITAANGRVMALTFTPATIQTPAPAGDALPTAPVEATAPAENTPKLEAPSASPAPADSPPAVSADEPPVQ